MTAVERSPITTAVLEALKTLGFPVGDNGSPSGPFGWQGEPDANGTNFIPWLTLTPLPGTGMGDDLASMGSSAFWRLGYSVYGAGVNRAQSEILMDRARSLLCGLGVASPVMVEAQVSTWNLAGGQCTSVGSNQRVGQTVPYYYTQTDTFELWVTEGE